MIPRGLVKVRPETLPLMARQQLKEQLTIYPQITSGFTTDMPEPIRVWDEDQDFLGIPRGYFNCNLKPRFDCQSIFEFSDGRQRPQETVRITPREGQDDVIEGAMRVLGQNPFGGAIIESSVASGKTAMALEIARRLNMKSLVVVHTTVLLEQWVKEIGKFFPNWKVGVVRSDKVETDGMDCCVSIINSVAMRDYPAWLYDEFGLIIVDECHLVCSREFSRVLMRFRPKYILGLSGTLVRADRAENVFLYGVGKVVRGGSVAVLKPTVYFVDTKYVCSSRFYGSLDQQKVQFLRSVIYDDGRNSILIQNAVKAALSGRNVLMLSERVDHVEILYRALVKELVPRDISVGMMVGETPKAMREKQQTSQVLVATSKLLGTGFNNPKMDTLIYCTPIQNITQSCGRILRVLPEKKDPIVVDPFDSCCSVSLKLAKFRWRKYVAKGWTVHGDRILRN